MLASTRGNPVTARLRIRFSWVRFFRFSSDSKEVNEMSIPDQLPRCGTSPGSGSRNHFVVARALRHGVPWLEADEFSRCAGPDGEGPDTRARNRPRNAFRRTSPSLWMETAAGRRAAVCRGSRDTGRRQPGSFSGGGLLAVWGPGLTLYAFSAENWKRPRAEVEMLWRLLRIYLRREMPILQRNNIRLQSIGRVEALPAAPSKNCARRSAPPPTARECA